MTAYLDLSDEVHMLKLEVKKLELENRITELKSEQLIDGDCIGCAGPCNANLQKELDEYKETIQLERIDRAVEKDVINRKYSEDLRKKNATIEELKDRNIEDLHELYDLYEEELRGIKADRTSIKSDRDIMFQNYQNTGAKLQGDIRGLEAELSARKEDSRVLMKVVEAIRDLQNLTGMVTTYDMRHIRDMVQDYLDAPEAPSETSIDDLYGTTVSIFLEMP